MIIMFFLKNIEMLLLNDYDAVIIGHSQLLKYINMLLLNRLLLSNQKKDTALKYINMLLLNHSIFLVLNYNS